MSMTLHSYLKALKPSQYNYRGVHSAGGSSTWNSKTSRSNKRVSLSSMLPLISLGLLSSASASATELRCGLDPKVNRETWPSYLDEIGMVFGVSSLSPFSFLS